MCNGSRLRIGAPSYTALDPIPPDQFVSTCRDLISQYGCSYQEEVTLYFSGITPAHIAALDGATEYTANEPIDQAGHQAQVSAVEPSLRHSRITYSGNPGLLAIKMPGRKHERIIGRLIAYLNRQISQMGLEDSLENMSASRITPANQGGACKEGDITYLPQPSRQMNQCPSLAIEIGLAQSLPELHDAKDWWFDMTPPEEGVNVVLLVKCFLEDIRFECWIRGNPEPSIVEVRRGSVPGSQPGLTRRAWVATGPMAIPFELVMLRPKEAGEGDFVLEEGFLAELAQQVLM